MDGTVVMVEGLKWKQKVYHQNDGFFYVKKYSRGGRDFFCCVVDNQCPGRATMYRNRDHADRGSLVVTRPHNHVSSFQWLAVAETRKRILQRCQTDAIGLREIYRQEIERYVIVK